MENLFENFNINTILSSEINDIIKQIDDSDSKNIILVGPRSSGKTTTIVNYENKHKKNKDIVISPDFNKIGKLPMDIKERMYEVELILCEELIKYIDNINLLEFYKAIIDNLKNELYGKCSSRIYISNNELIYMEKGKILSVIIDVVKKETLKNNVILIVDRFDWINNSSKVFQEILTSFFSFFSKNILITEDESILMDSRLHKLKNNGYDVVYLNYTKDIMVLKEMIILRLKMVKSISLNAKKLLEDRNVEYLINLSKGNLNVIFYVIDEIINLNYQLSDDEMLEFLKSKINKKIKMYDVITRKKLQL